MVCYDTGGLIYDYLRYQRGLIFAGLDVALNEGQVHHYLGVTRSLLFHPVPLDTMAADVADEVKERLASRYRYEWTP
jgi:hypothetical protein